MKPCRKHKRAIALLASSRDRLSVVSNQLEVEQHLEECPACIGYYRQMEVVCDEHSAAAESLPTAELSPYFLTRLRRKLNAQPQRFSWRFALLTSCAAIMLVIFILAPSNSPRQVSLPVVARISSPISRTIAGASAGTKLMTYHSAATRSLDELDEILFKQAQKGPRMLPEYRAGQSRLESE